MKWLTILFLAMLILPACGTGTGAGDEAGAAADAGASAGGDAATAPAPDGGSPPNADGSAGGGACAAGTRCVKGFCRFACTKLEDCATVLRGFSNYTCKEVVAGSGEKYCRPMNGAGLTCGKDGMEGSSCHFAMGTKCGSGLECTDYSGCGVCLKPCTD